METKLIYALIFGIFLFGTISNVSAIGTMLNCSSYGSNMCFHSNNDSSVGENYTIADSKVYDYSDAHANNGTTKKNITYNPTGGYLRDGAFSFDGIDDYITAGNIDINYSEPFTVMAWAKSSNRGTQQMIMSKYFRTFELYFNSGNGVTFRVWHSNTFANKTEVSYSTVNTTAWGFYVGVWNGTDALIYVNGKFRNNVNSTYPYIVFDATDPVVVGSETGTAYFFNGSIDEPVLINRSLSATEISTIYKDYVGNCSDEIITNCRFYSGIHVLNGSTYNFDDVSSNGAIIIDSNDTWLDCNNSRLIGSSTLFGSGIFLDVTANKNITITNCNMSYFYEGITRFFPPVVRRDNINYTNNEFSNIGYWSINADGLNNGIIANNRMTSVNYTGIRVHSNQGSIVENNNITLLGSAFAGIFNDGRNNIIRNNKITLGSGANAVGLRIEQDGSYNMNNNSYIGNIIQGNSTSQGYGYGSFGNNFGNYLLNNTFNNLQYCIYVIYNYTTIDGNLLNNCNGGIIMSATDNYNNITNNQITNFTTGMDIINSVDNLFINNTLTNGSKAIQQRGVANNSFNNNIIINSTYQYYSVNTATFKFLGLVSALLFNQNKSIYGSSNMFLNNGNINVTLTPDNSSILLNNYNLTEGQTRDYSPIWFSSSSSTEKHIASNLSNNITIPVIISVPREPESIYYESDTGIYNYTLTSNNWTFNPLALTLTFNLSGIEPANNSNVLSIYYSTTGSGGGSGTSTYSSVSICNILGDYLAYRSKNNTFYYNESTLKEIQNVLSNNFLGNISTSEIKDYLDNYNLKCGGTINIQKSTIDLISNLIEKKQDYFLITFIGITVLSILIARVINKV